MSTNSSYLPDCHLTIT